MEEYMGALLVVIVLALIAGCSPTLDVAIGLDRLNTGREAAIVCSVLPFIGLCIFATWGEEQLTLVAAMTFLLTAFILSWAAYIVGMTATSGFLPDDASD